MSELKTMLSALKIVADEFEQLQGVVQAQCILDSIQILETQQEKIVALTAERDQLVAQVNELKVMAIDAMGDGWYDGYLQCQKDVKAESESEFSSVIELNEDDVRQMSEDYESNHRYSKSINDIKAAAVMHFAEMNRGAYSSGFIPAHLTVYDVYQSARNHVKDNYSYETKLWDDADAVIARNALADLKASSGNELESLRDAIQACENQGFRVMYGNTQITGAILSDSVIELVNE